MNIDWTISFGNLIVFFGSVAVSVIGWFIVATLNAVNKSLNGLNQRVTVLETTFAAGAAYDKGYAEARREATRERDQMRQDQDELNRARGIHS